MLLDAVEREKALDCSKSFIVQAPAGSGKTGVLSQRILGLLARVERPEEVVAITFTKKAAGEMRQRVLEAIQDAKHNPCPAVDYEAKTWHLCQAVIQRDEQQGWHLLKHPNRLKIQTIDGFCGSLVKQMPYESNMGSMPLIEEDATSVYENAAKQLLNSVGDGYFYDDALQRLLHHIDNNYRLATHLISQMLEKRDHWLEDIVTAKLQGQALRQRLEATLEETVSAQIHALSSRISDDLKQSLVTLALYAAQNLQFDNVESPIRDALAIETDSVYLDTPSAWIALSELLLTKGKAEYRKRFDAKVGFPAPTGSKDPTEKAQRKSQKEAIVRLVGQLEDAHPDFRHQLHGVRGLPCGGYSDTQWALLVDLLELMPVAAGYLTLAWQESGKVDFTEISLSALKALGSSDEPTDLALKYDNRISHLLVDEFQDTSVLQIKLLEKLTYGWEPGDGRSLFLVGDPMQGIYSFRKADIGLFLDVWHRETLGDVALEPLKLVTNFRSDEKVIHWINDVFFHAFPREDSGREGAVSYSESIAAKQGGEGAGVSLKVFQEAALDAEDKENDALAFADHEATYIARSIAEVREQPRFSSQSIAVLVRSKGHAKPIIDALTSASIPYRAVDINTLQDSDVIQQLFGITRALIKPSDRIGWYSVLRGPWAGITLSTLESLYRMDEKACLWTNIQQLLTPGEHLVDPRDLDILRDIATLFTFYYDNRKQFTLRDAVESLWKNLGGSLFDPSQATLEDAEKYFQLVESLEESGDLGRFDTLEQKALTLFSSPGSTDEHAVQIMSMHKSKGLEFDHVFIPYSAKSGKSDERPLLIVDSGLSASENKQQLFLAALPEKGAVQGRDAVYEYLWLNHATRIKNELSRLTYVACTRAKTHLYITATLGTDKKDACKSPGNGTVLGALWAGVTAKGAANNTQVVDPEPVAENRHQHLSILSDPVINALAKKRALLFDTTQVDVNHAAEESVKLLSANEETEAVDSAFRAKVGVFAHRLFKKFADFHGVTVQKDQLDALLPSWRLALAGLGVEEQQLDEATGIIQRAVAHLIDYPEQAAWLFNPYVESYAELGLTTRDTQGDVRRYVVDRTFVDSHGVRWIIDYKFSEPDKGVGGERFLEEQVSIYREQLDTYECVMNRQNAVKTGLMLYFPLTNQYFVWSNNESGNEISLRPFE